MIATTSATAGQAGAAQTHLQRARALCHQPDLLRDPAGVSLWRRYCWALLADLYCQRGDLQGRQRCITRAFPALATTLRTAARPDGTERSEP